MEGGRPDAVLEAAQSFRRVFTAFQRVLAAGPRGGVSGADLLVLHHIAHAGQATPSRLAEVTGLTSGGVTGLLDRLEGMGLVRRERSDADRRVVVVRLEDGAHARLAAAMHEAHARMHAMFDGWETSEIEALAAMLGRLRLDRLPPHA